MSVTDEIKARLDIVDVISDTVTLKKSGRNFTGFCPFHSNTKTPSFVVFPETQTWRCFGACADGGDVFSFVIRREGYTFKEALELLAQRAGVQLKQPGPRATRQQEQRRKLIEINNAAAEYYHHLLTASPTGAEARAYLAGRDFTAETIATFQLGYAPDEWEALKGHLTGRGYSSQDILAAGLIVERDEGQPGYDRFRNRLVIPIRDSRGRVIGFGARALAADQMPKYLNSPQTALFDKSATLYGLDLARKQIRQAGQAVIVEGYMDVIQAHQRGAGNVVAQMGTALTEPQLKRLAQLTHRITLALDSDAAGNAATVRGLSLARRHFSPKKRRIAANANKAVIDDLSPEIYIAALPTGQDPDDILREGLSVWQEILARAVPILDYYEELILGQADVTTPPGKAFVVRELIPIYREVRDEIEKAARVQRLARKIGLDERLLLAELQGGAAPTRSSSRQRQPSPPPPEPPAEPEVAPLPSEKPVRGEEYCLALILANPSTLAMANETLEAHELPGLTANDFKRGEHREIFKQVQLWTASETPKIEVLTEMVEAPLEQRLTALVSQGYRHPPAQLENINHDLALTILRLRHQNITEQIKELQFLQREAIENQDIEGNRRYAEMVELYRQQRKKLDETRDALSLMGQRRVEANQYGQLV